MAANVRQIHDGFGFEALRVLLGRAIIAILWIGCCRIRSIVGIVVDQGLWDGRSVFLLQHEEQTRLDLQTSSLNETQRQEQQTLLGKFEDVFSEPTGFPPYRKFDHSIPLLVDKPITCRPYRYGPAKKNEIEKQVQ